MIVLLLLLVSGLNLSSAGHDNPVIDATTVNPDPTPNPDWELKEMQNPEDEADHVDSYVPPVDRTISLLNRQPTSWKGMQTKSRPGLRARWQPLLDGRKKLLIRVRRMLKIRVRSAVTLSAVRQLSQACHIPTTATPVALRTITIKPVLMPVRSLRMLSILTPRPRMRRLISVC